MPSVIDAKMGKRQNRSPYDVYRELLYDFDPETNEKKLDLDFQDFLKTTTGNSFKWDELPSLYLSYAQQKINTQRTADGKDAFDYPEWYDPTGRMNDKLQIYNYMKSYNVLPTKGDTDTLNKIRSYYKNDINMVQGYVDWRTQTEWNMDAAKILGIPYTRDMIIPQWYDVLTPYYPYTDSPDDQLRKQYKLAPVSYTNEFTGPYWWRKLLAGELPPTIIFAQNYVDAYNNFYNYIQNLAKNDQLNEQTYAKAFAKYEPLAEMQDFYTKLEDYQYFSSLPKTEQKRYREAPAAPTSPINMTLLNELGLDPGLAGKVEDELYQSMTQFQTQYKNPTYQMLINMQEERNTPEYEFAIDGIKERLLNGDRVWDTDYDDYLAALYAGFSLEPDNNRWDDALFEKRNKISDNYMLENISRLNDNEKKDILYQYSKNGKSMQVLNAYITVKDAEQASLVIENHIKEIVQKLEESGYTIDTIKSADPDYQSKIDKASKEMPTSDNIIKDYTESIMFIINSPYSDMDIEPDNPDDKEYRKFTRLINSKKPNGMAIDFRVLLNMTDDEKDVVRYLYGSGRADEIATYLGGIRSLLEFRQQESDMEKLSQEVDAPGIGGEIKAGWISILNDLSAPISLLETGINSLTGKETDLFSPAQLSARASIMAENIALKNQGTVGKIAGELIIGTAKMATKLPFGPTGSLVYIASAAGGTAATQALYSGATSDQAALYGLAVGCTQALIMAIPIKNLLNISGKVAAEVVTKGLTRTAIEAAIKPSITLTLKNAGILGSAFLVGNYANTLADITILGDKSNYRRYYNQLVAEGMSLQDAQTQAALKFFVYDPLMSLGSGFGMGLLFGAFESLKGYKIGREQWLQNLDNACKLGIIIAQEDLFSGSQSRMTANTLLDKIRAEQVISTSEKSSFLLQLRSDYYRIIEAGSQSSSLALTKMVNMPANALLPINNVPGMTGQASPYPGFPVFPLNMGMDTQPSLVSSAENSTINHAIGYPKLQNITGGNISNKQNIVMEPAKQPDNIFSGWKTEYFPQSKSRTATFTIPATIPETKSSMDGTPGEMVKRAPIEEVFNAFETMIKTSYGTNITMANILTPNKAHRILYKAADAQGVQVIYFRTSKPVPYTLMVNTNDGGTRVYVNYDSPVPALEEVMEAVGVRQQKPVVQSGPWMNENAGEITNIKPVMQEAKRSSTPEMINNVNNYDQINSQVDKREVLQKPLISWLNNSPDLLKEARKWYNEKPEWWGIDPDKTRVFYRPKAEVDMIRKLPGESGGHHPHGLALGGPIGQKLTSTGESARNKNPIHSQVTGLQRRVINKIKEQLE